tara:strand:- start:20736 stop:21266 length:531 start_codon:yes stop_codon:yes gene_type:complete
MSKEGNVPDLVWYAAYVRFRNEFKVAELIQEKLGLETCVPTFKVWRKNRNSRETLEKPMLETYVFFKANIEHLNLKSFYMINGIINLVRLAGKAAVIPEEEIATLRILGSSGSPVHEVEYKKLKANQKIQVCDGPLKGAIGTFLRSDEHTGRLIVSVDIFQRSLQTQVEASFVKEF